MTTGTTLDDYTDRYAQRVRGMTTSEIRALFAVANRPEVVSLAGGSPYVAALPLDAVGQMLGELGSVHGATTLQYGIGQGDVVLRERICEVMTLAGIDASVGASPDDVVVTVGGQQALDLVSRVFLDPGDVVLAEGPSYVGALGVFQAAQADVVHVPMDDDGLIPAALSEAIATVAAAGKRAKFLYVVPAHQNPAGVTLPNARRDEILAICQAAGLLILEDDPYGLLGFDGETLPALRSRARDGVIYVSTFSKTFAPGLRVGWKKPADSGGSAIEQYIVIVGGVSQVIPVPVSDPVGTQYFTNIQAPGTIANGSAVGFSVSARNSAPNSLATWNADDIAGGTPDAVSVDTRWGDSRSAANLAGLVAARMVAPSNTGFDAPVCGGAGVLIIWLAGQASPATATGLRQLAAAANGGVMFTDAGAIPAIEVDQPELTVATEALTQPADQIAARVRQSWTTLTAPGTSVQHAAQILGVAAPVADSAASRGGCQ